jgi:putative transcriptional regulator
MATRLPAHHPADDQLMAYATGEMAEAQSLLVATHLALCPACRRQVGDYEALGGQLMAGLQDAPLTEGSLSWTLARLDGSAVDSAPAQTARPAPPMPGHLMPGTGVLPQPLRDYMSQAWADKATWRKAMPGLRTLKLKAEGAKVWMMEVSAGKPIPHHGHTGQEMILVLSGGYRDGPTGYGPGDVHQAGTEIVHEPVADADGPCLCLVLEEGSIRPTSWLGRIVSGLMGY